MTKTIVFIILICVIVALIIFGSIFLAKRSSKKNKIPKQTIYCKNCIWYLRAGDDEGYCIYGKSSESLADCPEKKPKDTCENATFGAKPS